MNGTAVVSVSVGKISPPPPVRMAIELHSPVQEFLRGFIDENRTTKPLEVLREGSCAGKTLALCGAGPSLAKHEIEGVDDIFACNSALPYLVSCGVSVTAGVGIDQTPGMVQEWPDPPDVPYLIATSCDPALVRHLQAHHRRVIFFHNAVGIEQEFQHYCETWPPTFMVGQGATVVSRMISVAEWMGFERIDVYGADCAFGPDDVTHANGTSAVSAYGAPIIMTGETRGKTYRTRPDMLMGAVDLAKRVHASKGRIRLIGDTLPVQLLGKSDEYLNDVCRRLAPGELIPQPTSGDVE